MMLLERQLVAAVLGIGLLSTTGFAPGQTPSRKSQVVQPKQGPPPDQAEQPDPPAQVESNAEPEPAPQPDAPPPPPATPDQDPTPPPAQAAPAEQATTPDAATPEDQSPQEAPATDQKMLPVADQVTPDETAPQAAPAPVQQTAAKGTPPPRPLPPVRPAPPVGNAAQQQLQKETDTLLQLAQDLKAEIEKAGSNTLSLAALHKADEIQRLTKNLKEKMKEEEQAPAGK